jgi:hypothetical protein
LDEQLARRCFDYRIRDTSGPHADFPLFILMLRVARSHQTRPLNVTELVKRIRQTVEYVVCDETVDLKMRRLKNIGYLRLRKPIGSEDGRYRLVELSATAILHLDRYDQQLANSLQKLRSRLLMCRSSGL